MTSESLGWGKKRDKCFFAAIEVLVQGEIFFFLPSTKCLNLILPDSMQKQWGPSTVGFFELTPVALRYPKKVKF